MRIVVTGSKGQLGSELMPLLERHHDVVGLDLHNCDLTDRDAVLGAITSVAPDLVFHGAAFTAVDRCESEPETAYRVNCLATRFIADGARRVGAHVVYVSTDYVFDGTKDGPYLEWDEPNPQSVYGRSKLGGERELDPAWTVARTSWVCSAHGSNMVKTVLKVAAERDTLSFVDDQLGHPTFAGDLAAMLVRVGVARMPGVFHVTNAGAVSWYGFVREIMAAAGHDPDRVQPISTAQFEAGRPPDAPPMAPRPANSVLENFALRHSGIEPLRDFREPLAEVVARLQAD
ncbi:MAG: dTDP-4-dehydrorhamnose reductase [Microthrixaceae bacterium]|nr:dTDP-4-dehydrorhamnose reductase [Microthrixaceae bacterium]